MIKKKCSKCKGTGIIYRKEKQVGGQWTRVSYPVSCNKCFGSGIQYIETK